MEQKTLPAIADLYGDVELQSKQNDLNILLNQPPKPEWLKLHPFATKKTEKGNSMPCEYIPIERIEFLLTRIFIRWWVEIKTVQLIANSIVVTVRLHYQNPLDLQWDTQDGIGAVPLQTDKDAGATNFDRIKSNAVQIGAPAAESYAVKDAAEKIGKLFGKDINRADEVAYSNLGNTFQEIDQIKKEVSDALDFCQDESKTIEIADKIHTAQINKTDTVGFYQEILKALINHV